MLLSLNIPWQMSWEGKCIKIDYMILFFQQLLSQEMSTYGSVHSSTLPELPIPMLDNNATKVLVGHKPQHNQGKQLYICN